MPWYKFCPIWGRFGICFSLTGASHNKHDGFERERTTFGDGIISVASYCFQISFSCQHRTTGVLCDFFVIFRGSLGYFYALTEFSMHFMCIIQI